MVSTSMAPTPNSVGLIWKRRRPETSLKRRLLLIAGWPGALFHFGRRPFAGRRGLRLARWRDFFSGFVRGRDGRYRESQRSRRNSPARQNRNVKRREVNRQ